MGKGRDKRKKHEDPTKAHRRSEKQAQKLAKGQVKAKAVDAADGTNLGGLNNEEDVSTMVAKLQKANMKRRHVEEVEVPHPPPRVNAVIVKHPTRDGEIVMFGGEVWDGVTTVPFADLLIFNVSKNQWRQLLSPGGPSPRSSCQLWTHKQFVFVHGGEFVSPSQSQYLHFRDCFRLDTNSGVWEQLGAGTKGAGVCPSARSGHRVALWKRDAVLFGGFYDNALEVRYFDDLWVLSNMEGHGQWHQIVFDQFAEKPHPRSGHCLAVCNDDVFVYGGFFTHKASRFERAEATVLHDLWTTSLRPGTPSTWTKIRLAGIPPPIRAGVSCAAKDKRIIFFGGVVDVDGPGGSTLSSFTNDLFVFHTDSRKFYPLLLKGLRKGRTKEASPAPTGNAPCGGTSLAAEIALLTGQTPIAAEDDATDSDEEGEVTAPSALTASGLATLEPASKMSFEVLPSGATVPCPRMNAMMTFLDGHTLVLVGGQYETAGEKEVTLNDVYTLNLNRMDTFTCLHAQDLTQTAWRAEPSEASGSWEDGSTVVSMGEIGAHDEDDDDHDEEEEDEEESTENRAPAPAVAAAAVTVDSRTNVKGKPGLQKHKLHLEQQLSTSSDVPAPHEDEACDTFFERTRDFWLLQAAELRAAATGLTTESAAVRRDAARFCKMRYDEASALQRQLRDIDEKLRVEREAIRVHLEAKRMAMAEAEDSSDDETPPAIPIS